MIALLLVLSQVGPAGPLGGQTTHASKTTTPGGSSPQMQYDNGGVFGGVSNVESDGTHEQVIGEPGAPTAPSGVNKALHYDLAFDSGFPNIPFTKDAFLGTPIPVGLIGNTFQGYAAGGANWDCHCVQASGWADNTFVIYREVANPLIQGTSTNPGWASTSLYTRLRYIVQQSTTAINSSAEVRASRQSIWRGNATGAGGWVSQQRFGFDWMDGGMRSAVGFFSNTGTFTAASDPNAELTDFYVGCNSNDTNLSVCSNDSTSTATCNSLGSSFPCAGVAGSNVGITQVAYEFWTAAAPNSSVINYYIRRIDTAAEASGQINSDLPVNTSQMGWHVYANSGPDNHAARLTFFNTCVCANP